MAVANKEQISSEENVPCLIEISKTELDETEDPKDIPRRNSEE